MRSLCVSTHFNEWEACVCKKAFNESESCVCKNTFNEWEACACKTILMHEKLVCVKHF